MRNDFRAVLVCGIFFLGLHQCVSAEDASDVHYNAYLAALQEKLPERGLPAFDGSSLKGFDLLGEGSDAHYEISDCTDQPFAKCIRVKILKALDPQYKVQVLTPATKNAVKKGDYIFVILNARCVDAEGGLGIISANIQKNSGPWTGIGHDGFVVGKEWRRFYVCGHVEQDYPAGGYALALHLAGKAQTLELGGIAMLNFGPNLKLDALPYTPISYPGQEADAPWRKAAAERIDKIRKGDLRIEVVGADGRPVPGASVHLAMQRHAFGFGTFLEYEATIGSGSDSDKLREWTLKLFNRATTPIYWADWGWANPDIRKNYLVAARWAQDHALATRGHVIVYPAFNYMPNAQKALEKDPVALRKSIAEHVIDVVEATKQLAFREYDVTNELRDCQDLHRILGKDVVAEWFKLARAHAAPETRLALNENTILTRGGLTLAEQDNYAGWIQYLIDQKCGPEVIGMQGHFDSNVTDPEVVLKTLDRFAKFGRPLQITEFDLATRDEDGQARYMRDFLTTVFSHPAIEAFTMWGFWEGRMWQPVGALIRKNWTLKPNGQAYMDLVFKQWWTDTTAQTDAKGVCAVRGFLGDYKITVNFKGTEKQVDAKLLHEGTQVTVKLD